MNRGVNPELEAYVRDMVARARAGLEEEYDPEWGPRLLRRLKRDERRQRRRARMRRKQRRGWA